MRLNLTDILYKTFLKEERERSKQDVVTFAPSYLSKCGRAIYYDKSGMKPSNPPDLPSLLKMEWGNILHDDIQERLEKLGYLESFEVHKQIEFEGLTFHYYYDGILNVDGQRAIMEIKTVYASGYKSIEEKPKEEHILQTISYMVFEGIADAVILYAGRDNGFLKQFHLNLLDLQTNTDYYEKWRLQIARMKALKQIIESGEIPVRDYQIALKNDKGTITDTFQKDSVKYKSDWQCSYCSHKDTCWAKELEQIKEHKFYINGKFIN